MFKFITYIRYDESKHNTLFKLTDTEFECEEVQVVEGASELTATMVEYERRNYSHDEIVKNLFKCILFLRNRFFPPRSFEETLDTYYTYEITYFNNLKFHEKYYQDVKDMWDKYKVFI